ncbi:hypothetical protein LK03_20425 [Pseudomonas cremoricolorata]|uniref:Uncharacterized protein n=1 Tax=Pseudomonas cremoricolorata TaxID=157783 RepID=A0A089WSA2_9PSED|nr:hypothetical protein LK03_20425 [Pseudomonas cremoricolorata]
MTSLLFLLLLGERRVFDLGRASVNPNQHMQVFARRGHAQRQQLPFSDTARGRAGRRLDP